MDVIKLLEGLEPAQAKQFTARLPDVLQALRDEITAGDTGETNKKKDNNMIDNIKITDLNDDEMELFKQALPEVLNAIKGKAPQPAAAEPDDLAQQEAAELAALQASGKHGLVYINSKSAIANKYRQLRAQQGQQQQAAATDAIMSAKDRGTLVKEYKAEWQKVRRGDISSMSALKSKYRPYIPDIDQISGE